MSGPRLLIVADQKMLPALANGLREGGKFDVQTAALSDPAGAQAAADQAESVAVFYGGAGVPLATALQKLSPRVRERGGRVVAVLQREQAAQRDECFRSGASDLLFMPMPKDQFVGRLAASVALNWAAEGGADAAVSVSTRSASMKLDAAKVSAAGVEAPGDLALKGGETVRVSWAGFQVWGLVVRGAPGAQIRFAGLAPDEEEKIRDWLKNEAVKPATPPPPPVEAAAEKPAEPAAPAPAAAPPPAEAPPPPPADAGEGPRAAPALGPPPGFADRKPIRPQTRPPTRIPPPVMSAAGAASAAPAAATPATPSPPPPPPAASAAPPPSNGAGALAGIFEEGAPAAAPAGGPAEAAAAAAPATPSGPPWPVPVPVATCKAAALQFLKDKLTPPDMAPGLAGSVKKIAGMLSSSERSALEKAGSDSHFAESLGTRIALDAASSEALRLFAQVPPPSFDAAAAASLTRSADEAAARLQKEANTAIGKGEVESLQLLTGASAALSRDLLNFKEAADRLRGIGAAPRLGAGALDPDIVLPGQAPKARAVAGPAAPAPVKAELRDFQGLEQKAGGRAKNIVAIVLVVGAIVAAVNGFYFGLPHHGEIPAATAGDGVVRVDLAGESAMVTVSPDWAAHAAQRVGALSTLLKDHGVKKAIVMLPSGKTVGLLNTVNDKFTVPKPAGQ